MLAIGFDLAFGEPPNRWHPVAWLGQATARLEQAAPKRGRAARLGYGAVLVGLLVGGSAAIGRLLERMLGGQATVIRIPLEAGLLKLSFSLHELAEVADQVRLRLEAGSLVEARANVRALVSRPTAELGSHQVASAAIESLAENLSDSFIAPMLAYLAFGAPGALAYRAANTLDAMIGYHGEYEDLGKAAARLDDLCNLLPARFSALLLVGAAWLGLGNGRAAWSALRHDRARTASPNAGWPMSAAAGALGVRLEKIGHYRLGGGFPDPAARDIERAARLYYGAAALGVAVVVGSCYAEGVIHHAPNVAP